MKQVYLDHAATTQTDPRVVEAMLPYFTDIYGNPSSLHGFGQEAWNGVEEARERIATFLGAKPEEIIFTSGGTEGNNFAIKGVALALKDKGNHIITSAIEHDAVLEPCRSLEKLGFKVTYLRVDECGLVDPNDVRKAITDKTILISIMHANNEIGTIEPIEDIGNIAQERDVYFHTDAVQTFGHLSIQVDQMNVDLLSASAHKIYGPKGVGILYVRQGTMIRPFMEGGGQERKRRASTENVPGIVGFGRAVALAQETMTEEANKLRPLRDKFIKEVLEKIEDTRLNGHPVRRLPNNTNIAIASVEGEFLLLNLDMLGIACSTGAACCSTTVQSSHVLMAIGLPHDLARGSLRFSLGRATTEEEIDYVIAELPVIVEKLRSISPLYKKRQI
jgi:cysteine desulfurase